MKPAAILQKTAHRPWQLPPFPWALQMGWRDLVFLHWPVDPEKVRPLLPPNVWLDTFNDRAWIGIVPFMMVQTRLRLSPAIPTATNFEELNVRTYVVANGRPGIWFFSLDAASRLAVRAARIGVNLPYFDADMALEKADGRCGFSSRRIHRGAPKAAFRGRYWPIGPAAAASPGTLEHWLVERYCLFTQRRGRIFELDIHHPPWPLQPAAAEIAVNTMAEANGIQLPRLAPLVHFAESLDVLAWPPFPVSENNRRK